MRTTQFPLGEWKLVDEERAEGDCDPETTACSEPPTEEEPFSPLLLESGLIPISTATLMSESTLSEVLCQLPYTGLKLLRHFPRLAALLDEETQLATAYKRKAGQAVPEPPAKQRKLASPRAVPGTTAAQMVTPPAVQACDKNPLSGAALEQPVQGAIRGTESQPMVVDTPEQSQSDKPTSTAKKPKAKPAQVPTILEVIIEKKKAMRLKLEEQLKEAAQREEERKAKKRIQERTGVKELYEEVGLIKRR